MIARSDRGKARLTSPGDLAKHLEFFDGPSQGGNAVLADWRSPPGVETLAPATGAQVYGAVTLRAIDRSHGAPNVSGAVMAEW
jgi:hypothetical protein